MANKKHFPSLLVSGLGMGMAFLRALVDEVIKQGGFDEMIHALSLDTEQAHETIRKLAKVIVKSKWRIPRSLMERLARSESAESSNTEHYPPEAVQCLLEHDTKFWWNLVELEAKFGIPVISVGDPLERGLIPDSLSSQIMNKVVTYPLIVEWEGEPHVVVGGTGDGWEILREGENCSKIPNHLTLTPARYFDLER